MTNFYEIRVTHGGVQLRTPFLETYDDDDAALAGVARFFAAQHPDARVAVMLGGMADYAGRPQRRIDVTVD